MGTDLHHPASFRDPSGFIFKRDGQVYRQINRGYADKWKAVVESGFFESAVENKWLLPFEDVDDAGLTQDAAKVIKPEQLLYVSYAYEWCFSQLKDAALLTLDLAALALDHGVTLKDASAYNVQFHRGRPVFIDTLSFEPYVPDVPWVAYQQFCRHFLAPLALAALVDISLLKLMQVHIDGIPLKLASRLLPARTRFDFGLMSHIHLHARGTEQVAGESHGPSPKLPLTGFKALLMNLRSTIEKLKWEPKGTEWGDYYLDTNYTNDAMSAKRDLVSAFLNQASSGVCYDLGANTGEFSRLAAEKGFEVLACDMDPATVEKCYRWTRQSGETRITPQLVDLSQPSPAIGWANRERESFTERANGSVMMALALIHHLAIGNNVPLADIAQFFRSISPCAIVEWVPREDSQVQRLLASREDVFPSYTWEGFEAAFSPFFTISRAVQIGDSCRTLVLLQSK